MSMFRIAREQRNQSKRRNFSSFNLYCPTDYNVAGSIHSPGANHTMVCTKTAMISKSSGLGLKDMPREVIEMILAYYYLADEENGLEWTLYSKIRTVKQAMPTWKHSIMRVYREHVGIGIVKNRLAEAFDWKGRYMSLEGDLTRCIYYPDTKRAYPIQRRTEVPGFVNGMIIAARRR